VVNEVLVTLDGSEKDGRALAVALAVADLMNAGVRLVRVIPCVPERIAKQAEFLGLDRSGGGDRLDVEWQLAQLAERLTTHVDWPIARQVLEGASVPRLILEAARCTDVRAVVMGTRGPTQAGLALVGSVADEVMRDSPKPVVLVPPGTADLAGRQVHFRRLLVPLDDSPLAARSVDFLLALPHAHDLELVLVEVVQNPNEVPAAKRRLRIMADRASLGSARVTYHVIIAEETATAISGAVRAFFVDMIAMSTRGQSGLRRLVLGSIAQGVVRTAETPILLLTPAMLADSARVQQPGDTMNGFVGDIESLTVRNEDFRHVLYTGPHIQLVLMALEPGEEIGEEVHEENDQFFRVESGEGEVLIDGHLTRIGAASAIVVPAGARHNVRNTGSRALKLYTLYGPPHHADGTVHHTRADAEAAVEHFAGDTTE